MGLTEDHPDEKPVVVSGTRVREQLQRGERPDPRIMRPEIADVLIEAYRGAGSAVALDSAARSHHADARHPGALEQRRVVGALGGMDGVAEGEPDPQRLVQLLVLGDVVGDAARDREHAVARGEARLGQQQA